ncbi:MAG TPA: alpha/beta hydrolase [Nannocystaceae bacterium]|nr:alpha/beta hydrolase [Nannocystaceae bacterium]
MSSDDDGLRQVQRDDGAVIRYRACGPRDAAPPAILILDGIGCSGWAFKRILPALSERRRVILPDYRGHGRSPDPPRPWRLGMHVLADDAAAVCAHAGADRVIVVGFSMGFQVALEFFRRHRPRVAGMVSLAGPSGRVLQSFQGTHVFAHALPFVRAITRIGRDVTARAWKRLVPSPLTTQIGMATQLNADRLAAADFEFYTRQLAAVSPELFLAMLDEADRHSAEDVLPTIDVPTLVVAGARDTFVPLPTMRRLAFTIPHVRWEVLEAATHALPAEYPDEITETLRRFTAEVAAAANRAPAVGPR